MTRTAILEANLNTCYYNYLPILNVNSNNSSVDQDLDSNTTKQTIESHKGQSARTTQSQYQNTALGTHFSIPGHNLIPAREDVNPPPSPNT